MAEGAEELQHLMRKVRETIKERTDLAQRLANPEALRAATARAYRDRDAVTNPLLEEARAQVAADIAAFHDEWRQADQIARNIARIGEVLDEAPEHIQEHPDAIANELPEAYRRRAAIAERLRSAGLESILPETVAAHDQG